MPASASATCERAESAAAFCASAAATVASNCCCDTSSLASSPRSRSTSRAALAAFASASRTRACAVVSRARAASISRSARGDAALRLRDAAARGGDVAGRRGRRDRHVALRGERRGFGVGELGARLVDRHLVVARIELDEHRAGFDELVVVDGDARDGAADARRDLRDVRVHLRIVGRLAAGGQPEPDADADDDDEHEDAGADAEARLLVNETGCGRPSADASEKY